MSLFFLQHHHTDHQCGHAHTSAEKFRLKQPCRQKSYSKSKQADPQ